MGLGAGAGFQARANLCYATILSIIYRRTFNEDRTLLCTCITSLWQIRDNISFNTERRTTVPSHNTAEYDQVLPCPSGCNFLNSKYIPEKCGGARTHFRFNLCCILDYTSNIGIRANFFSHRWAPRSEGLVSVNIAFRIVQNGIGTSLFFQRT